MRANRTPTLQSGKSTAPAPSAAAIAAATDRLAWGLLHHHDAVEHLRAMRALLNGDAAATWELLRRARHDGGPRRSGIVRINMSGVQAGDGPRLRQLLAPAVLLHGAADREALEGAIAAGHVAAEVIAALGPSVVGAVVDALEQSPDVDVRTEAARALRLLAARHARKLHDACVRLRRRSWDSALEPSHVVRELLENACRAAAAFAAARG